MAVLENETVARSAAQPGRHFIDGQFCDARSGTTFDVINPATEEVTTTAARGGPDDVGAALQAAKDALDSGVWSRAKPSYRREAGVALVEHPDVIGVSFTGSPGTARDIAGRTAGRLSRTSFELGGRSACIVFADANLDRAMPYVAGNIFGNSWQMCIAGSRILVQRPIYERRLERFVAEAETWTVGDPLDRDLRQPFGGIKQSGVGREGGGRSREFFTETRFVSFPLTPR